jgi:hypothetical protein
VGAARAQQFDRCFVRLKPSSDSWHGSVSVYRAHLDDVEHIIHILESAGLTVTVSDSEYEYESLEELVRKRGVRPKRVIVSAANTGKTFASVQLTFARDVITWYGKSPPELSGMRQQIDAYLRSKRSAVVIALNPGVWGLLYLIGWFLRSSGWMIRYRDGREAWDDLAAVVVGIMVLSIAIHFLYRGLWLRRRHEGGFLRRNADQIGIALIGAIVGAILALVGTVLLQR